MNAPFKEKVSVYLEICISAPGKLLSEKEEMVGTGIGAIMSFVNVIIPG